jgi:hypothetical protein
MGKTFSTGLLTDGIWQDSSNNIGIGAANSSYKFQVTGTTNLTGALTGTTGIFSSSISINSSAVANYDLNIYNTIPRIQLQNPTSGTTTGDGFHIYQSGSDSYILNKEAANLYLGSNNGINLTIASTGAATFSSSVQAASASIVNNTSGTIASVGVYNANNTSGSGGGYEFYYNSGIRTGGVYNKTTGSGNGYYLSFENFNGTSAFEAMRIIGNGAVGIKITPTSGWGSNMSALQIGTGGVINNYTGSNNNLGIGVNYYDNGAGSQLRLYAGGTSNLSFSEDVFIFSSAGSNSAGTTITFIERMRLNANGYLKLKTVSSVYSNNTHRLDDYQSAQGNVILVSGNAEQADTIIIYSVSQGGQNAAATGMAVGRNSSTGRSINAGGGIYASGTDYAEYMTKAIEDIIAKGDIVGIDSDGLLTNIFENAKSFVVKSTDPSYIGGDTWGSIDTIGKLPEDATQEEKAAYEIKLQTARSKVDRIAFCGQVPCNVLNAQVGDYIIPINDNGKISGQAVTNPTFEQYQISVGKVWKIMEDGRAWIAVKIG